MGVVLYLRIANAITTQMKFSTTFYLLAIIAFVVSCKKDDDGEPSKAQFFYCNEFSEPAHNPLPLQFSSTSLNLMPFNDGYILGEDSDNNKYVLFDRNMKYVKDFDNIEGWWVTTLNDNSILSSASYAKNLEGYPQVQLSAYHFIGFKDNCEPYYEYQDLGGWNGWKAESFTAITKQKRNGEVEFRLTLEGYLMSNHRYNSGFIEAVERDGFIYLATLDVDSALSEFVEDDYGNFLDTVNIGCRNAKVNLFKLSYSGEMMWKKTVENVIGFQPDMGGYFGATKNYLWVFTPNEIVQFDFNGNLLRSNCREGDFNPIYFFDGGVLGTQVVDVLEYKVLTEGFSYEERPVNAPKRSFAVDGSVVFSSISDKIISYNFINNQTKVIFNYEAAGYVGGLAKGCDGSFYFCNSKNAAEQNLNRITKDGKSSF